MPVGVSVSSTAGTTSVENNRQRVNLSRSAVCRNVCKLRLACKAADSIISRRAHNLPKHKPISRDPLPVHREARVCSFHSCHSVHCAEQPSLRPQTPCYLRPSTLETPLFAYKLSLCRLSGFLHNKVLGCTRVTAAVTMEIDGQDNFSEVVVTESQTVWRDVQEKLREEDFEKAIQLCNKSEATIVSRVVRLLHALQPELYHRAVIIVLVLLVVPTASYAQQQHFA